MADRTFPELVEGSQRANIGINGKVLYADTYNADKRAESVVQAPQTLYVVTSPLLFYGIRQLLQNISDDSYILAVECNPEIFEFTLEYFKEFDCGKISYKLIGEDADDISIIRSIAPHRYRRIHHVRLNRGYMLYRNRYDTFIDTAESLIQTYWKNRMTTIHMGRLWCRNIFLNLKYLSGSLPISKLKTNKPVIAVGAGASLEKSIEFIKKYRDHFFLTAADTAVSVLLHYGIRPDLVIVLESQHANIYDFYETEALKFPAAFDLTSSPEIVRKHVGPRYFFVTGFQHSSLFESLKSFGLLPPILPALGNVGVSTVYLSLCISDKNVFYCGLDFSFTPDQYHASGAPSHLLTALRETRTDRKLFFEAACGANRIKKQDKKGNAVFTDLVMLSGIKSITELGRLSKRLFDIGLSGLQSGTPRLTIEAEIIEKTGQHPYAENRNSSPHHKFSLSGNEGDFDSADIYLDKEISKLENVVSQTVYFINNVLKDDTNLPISLNREMKEVDYTYLFFPDITEPVSDISFLKRFLFSASWFKTIMVKAKSIVSSED